ncbi:MAG: transposase domain-containing protein, partial [Paracoccaceae bacterium]
INPQAYLEYALEKTLSGHMQGDIQELMPWNFNA